MTWGSFIKMTWPFLAGVILIALAVRWYDDKYNPGLIADASGVN